MPDRWTVTRARLGVAVRTGAPADEIDALRRDLRAHAAASQLRRMVTAEPPFTNAQLDELAAIAAAAKAAA